MLRQEIEDQLDSIDAEVFTGDGIFSEEEIERFEWWLSRWWCEMEKRKKQMEEKELGLTKFKILVQNDNNEWWEEYTEDTNDAQAWAEEMVVLFNETLRPGELERRLLEVVVIDT